MTNSPVLELQELASSSSSDIQDVLLKAKVVSVKLNLDDLSEWLDYEINAYPSQDSVPEYRVIKNVPVRAFNPFHGWIHFDLSNIDDPEIYDSLTSIHITNPISMLQEYAKSSTTLYSDLPQPLTAFLNSFSNCNGMRIAWAINPTAITRIISTTKSRILDWSLELEKKGILGNGLLFSQKEKEVASMTVHNTTNINGNVNNAGVIGSGNNDISQNNTINVGDFPSLERELKNLGISDEDIRELKKAIDESPLPSTQDNLGGKIGSWIGKMVGQAYSGSLNIAASVAPAVLTNAICAYFNITS